MIEAINIDIWLYVNLLWNYVFQDELSTKKHITATKINLQSCYLQKYVCLNKGISTVATQAEVITIELNISRYL